MSVNDWIILVSCVLTYPWLDLKSAERNLDKYNQMQPKNEYNFYGINTLKWFTMVVRPKKAHNKVKSNSFMTIHFQIRSIPVVNMIE